jgi:hypothetical protein
MLRVLRPNDFAAAFAANFVVSEVPPFLSKVEVVVAAVDTTSELDNVSAPSLLRRNKFYKLFS